MNELFDSLNPYQTLEIIKARDPEELLRLIKQIKTPIGIINIVSHNNKLIAFIKGDVRKKKRTTKKKGIDNG
jgi:hypothetical protein